MTKRTSRIISPNEINRRDFLRRAGGGLATMVAGGMFLDSCEYGGVNPGIPLGADAFMAPSPLESYDDPTFRFAILTDTHIIDEFYTGPEGNELDTESIWHSAERLAFARGVINDFPRPVSLVIVAGDVFHNYPSTDYDFFFENKTRVDNAADLLAGFSCPVYPAWGNHDYDIGSISREFTHDLIKAKFGLDPYYFVDYRGWKFVSMNNFLGDTMDPSATCYDRDVGSFGEEQLVWFEDQLRQGMPTVVYFHYPLVQMAATEVTDLGMVPLLKKYRDTIRLVVAGHTHRWMNFGDMYGPVHLVAAATRYDGDSFLIVEVDTRTGMMDILNWDGIHWGTLYTRPIQV